jgi:hypothetical protein
MPSPPWGRMRKNINNQVSNIFLRTESNEKASNATDHRLGTREMEFKTAGTLTKIVSDKSKKINEIPREKKMYELSGDEESDDEALITEVGIQKENILSPPQTQDIFHMSRPGKKTSEHGSSNLD